MSRLTTKPEYSSLFKVLSLKGKVFFFFNCLDCLSVYWIAWQDGETLFPGFWFGKLHQGQNPFSISMPCAKDRIHHVHNMPKPNQVKIHHVHHTPKQNPNPSCMLCAESTNGSCSSYHLRMWEYNLSWKIRGDSGFLVETLFLEDCFGYWKV